MNKSRYYYLRVGVAVSMVALILVKVDLYEALGFFRNLDAFSVFLIFLISFVLIIISTYKWRIFLNHLELQVPFLKLFNFYFIGYFFNNFLPSNIGGDMVRFLFTTRGRGTYSDSLVAVFMERFTGLIALLLLITVSLPFALYHFNLTETLKYIVPALALITCASILVFFLKPDSLKKYPLSNRFLVKVRDRVITVLHTIQSFKKVRPLLTYTLFLSILFNLIAIVNVYVVALALDIQITFYSLFVFVPLILLISAIPLSINGIGIVEGAYVLCLTQMEITAPAALSIALVIRAKNLLLSMVGGIFFLLYKRDHADFDLARNLTDR